MDRTLFGHGRLREREKKPCGPRADTRPCGSAVAASSCPRVPLSPAPSQPFGIDVLLCTLNLRPPASQTCENTQFMSSRYLTVPSCRLAVLGPSTLSGKITLDLDFPLELILTGFLQLAVSVNPTSSRRLMVKRIVASALEQFPKSPQDEWSLEVQKDKNRPDARTVHSELRRGPRRGSRMKTKLGQSRVWGQKGCWKAERSAKSPHAPLGSRIVTFFFFF